MLQQLADRLDVTRSRGGPLFPEVTPHPLDARRVVNVIAVLTAGAVLALARQVGRGALDTLWAEDGMIFLQHALDQPFHESLTRSYAGYFHVLPRLISELLAALPLRWAAVGFGVIAALLAAVQAIVVFHATEGYFRTMAIRIALAASVIVLPLTRGEVVGVVANLHWLLLFTSFWVLLWNPRTTWGLAVGGAVLALTTLSDPLTLCLLPLALLRLSVLRGWRSRLFSAVLIVGLTIQTVATLVAGSERALDLDPNVVRIGGWYGFDVIARTVFGVELPGPARTGMRGALFLVVALAVVASLVVLARRLRPPWPASLAALAVASSVLLYVMPVFLAGLRTDRYAVTPSLLLLTAAGAILDRRAGAVSERTWTALRLGAGALLVIVVLLDFRTDDRASMGARWREQLSEARSRCASGSPESTDIPTTPEGWDVTVQCDQL